MIFLLNLYYWAPVMFSPLVKKLKSVLNVQEDHIIPIKNNKIRWTQDSTDPDLANKLKDLKESIFDCIKTIKDPEKPASLEDLNVVYEDGVSVEWNPTLKNYIVQIEFNPTVPHCSLATLIGLCVKVKLQRNFQENFKLNIFLKEGSHDTELEINKQINDKERVAAAMENPSLFDLVEKCIKEQD